jgi:hypothetical protein
VTVPLMCLEDRRVLVWVDAHWAEVSAWLLLRDGRRLEELGPFGRCDVGYAMLARGRRM